MKKSRLLGAVCACFLWAIPITSYAALIQIAIADSQTISLTFSGTLTGAAPTLGTAVLFIDTPTWPGTIARNFSSCAGDAMLGAPPLSAVCSGYDNGAYGGSLQLITSIPLVNLTLAIFLRAEFGFLGVIVVTFTHTPLF